MANIIEGRSSRPEKLIGTDLEDWMAGYQGNDGLRAVAAMTRLKVAMAMITPSAAREMTESGAERATIIFAATTAASNRASSVRIMTSSSAVPAMMSSTWVTATTI